VFVSYAWGGRLPGLLDAIACARGAAGDEAIGVAEVEGELKGTVLERAGSWDEEDLALARVLTRASRGYGCILTTSKGESTYGAALFFDGHRLALHSRGPHEPQETLRSFEHWELFEGWLRALGGPSPRILAEAVAQAPRDRDRHGVRDPGPPPNSAWVLLFAPGDEASSASDTLHRAGLSATLVEEALLIAWGPALPPEEVRRTLAAAHVAGAAWTLCGDGPPRLVEDFRDGALHPLPATVEGLLRACQHVTSCAGWPAGIVAAGG
jgi:hypothetical protein